MRIIVIVAAVSLVLAATAGFFVKSAISQGEPEREVTIDLEDGAPGEQGPPGPPGPRGPAGGTTCPTGYVFGKLTINHPGGQVVIFTCMTPESN